ncbi:MAG: hypothetical protein JW776_01060 [Candidatus Lokiarchaeota archaeon]|nr:hypothetical protein [Candidatus Lokiarchaeota archaeon]
MQEEQNTCPQCGERLNKGEISRINSGIDIACHTCGTEITGKERSELSSQSTDDKKDLDDLGEKIKKGIKTFVQRAKEWAEENFVEEK